VGVTGDLWVPGSALEFLRGRWRADRVIEDFRSGQRGAFHGLATFATSSRTATAGVPGALTYEEQGELQFGGHRGPASRSLIYLPGPDGTARVHFADGRPFFELDLATGTCRAEHPCRSDRYEMTVSVLGSDCYAERWRVTGPEKDYEMTTTLTRIGVTG
jgi:Family of unknown function (DUF6314)